MRLKELDSQIHSLPTLSTSHFESDYSQSSLFFVESTRELHPTQITRAMNEDTLRLVDFDCAAHRPNHLLTNSSRPITRSFECSTRRLSRAYYQLHEYLCSTCGAARLRFASGEFMPLMDELQSALDHNRAVYA